MPLCDTESKALDTKLPLFLRHMSMGGATRCAKAALPGSMWVRGQSALAWHHLFLFWSPRASGLDPPPPPAHSRSRGVAGLPVSGYS